MKKLNDDQLDKHFRDGLTDPKAPVTYREADWENMAALLDGRSGKKRGVILKIAYYVSGVAALFLLVFGLFFLNKDEHPGSPGRRSAGGNHLTKQGNNNSIKVPGVTLKSHDRSAAIGRSTRQVPAAFNYTITPVPDYQTPKQPADTLQQDLTLTPGNEINFTAATLPTDSLVRSLAINQIVDTAAVIPANAPIPERIRKQANSNVPTFALTLLGAPDINTVSSLNSGQLGSNISLQLSVRLTPKLSITTGAGYAIKPYQSSFAQYKMSYSPAVQPTDVTANCQVLDIPVNLNYQLYTKGNNSFALGTGISSYFMLKEKYRFDYAENSGTLPYNLTVIGKNQHLFGVLNINATYQRRINSKFSAVVQPYFKLPLTGIGNGQVDLRSTGVAIGFNWNINLLKKPK